MASLGPTPVSKLTRRLKGLTSSLHPKRILFRRIILVSALFLVILVTFDKGYLHLVHQRAPYLPKSIIHNTTTSSSNRVKIWPRNTTISQNNSSDSDDIPFQYLINEPEICNNDSNLYIINTIGIGAWDMKVRKHIRSLWANRAWQNITGVKTVFLLGTVTNPKIMADLKEESNKYHDIIQFSFLDTYDNFTFKTLGALHWVNNFCPTPVWVLKSDSDVLVNTFELNRFLKEYDEKTNHSRSHFICRKTKDPSPPCRRTCKQAKWRVSLEEYPHKYYPPYCFGPGYIIPRRLVAHLYAAANKTHPFRLEDVYYTGIIPQTLKWRNVIHNIADRFPWRPTAWQKSFENTDLMILELEKRMGQAASSKVWNKILKNRGYLSYADNETKSEP